MTAAAMQPMYLRYNPHETLDAFQARQRAAFTAGKAAWRAGAINGQALQLYEILVRYVGGNQCAWVKEPTLVEELGRSKSTIVRWMQQLVGAGLIRRDRRFGSSSLTYVTAYDTAEGDDVDAAPADADAQPRDTEEAPRTLEADTDQPANAGATSGAAAPDDQAGSPAASFFERRSEPSINPLVRRDPFKNPQLNLGGGGRPPGAPKAHVETTPTSVKLQQEGVLSSQVLEELHGYALADIEATIRYVARCRTRDDPRRPGLIVHLIRRGFSASRRKESGDRAAPPERQPGRPTSPDNGKPFSPDATPASPDDALTSTWRQVLDDLAGALDAQTYATWIAPNRLLLLEDDQAVVATPNVFVRDEVARGYGTQLEAALSHNYGRPIRLTLVIDSSLVEGG